MCRFKSILLVIFIFFAQKAMASEAVLNQVSPEALYFTSTDMSQREYKEVNRLLHKQAHAQQKFLKHMQSERKAFVLSQQNELKAFQQELADIEDPEQKKLALSRKKLSLQMEYLDMKAKWDLDQLTFSHSLEIEKIRHAQIQELNHWKNFKKSYGENCANLSFL